MRLALFVVAFGFAWVGHACVWVSLLNNLYGRPLPKRLLKLWRLLTGGIILASAGECNAPLVRLQSRVLR